MTPEQRRYLTELHEAEGWPGISALCEDACRRCSAQSGLSPDWRCHSNADPIEAACRPLTELVDERIEAQSHAPHYSEDRDELGGQR